MAPTGSSKDRCVMPCLWDITHNGPLTFRVIRWWCCYGVKPKHRVPLPYWIQLVIRVYPVIESKKKLPKNTILKGQTNEILCTLLSSCPKAPPPPPPNSLWRLSKLQKEGEKGHVHARVCHLLIFYESQFLL